MATITIEKYTMKLTHAEMNIIAQALLTSLQNSIRTIADEYPGATAEAFKKGAHVEIALFSTICHQINKPYYLTLLYNTMQTYLVDKRTKTMHTKGMKDLEILQFDINMQFDRIRRFRPSFDLTEYERVYDAVTDVDTKEIRTDPETIETAEQLLDDLIWIKQNGTEPQ